jgi:hypothetical protein
MTIAVNSPEWCLYGNGKDVLIVADNTTFLLNNVLLTGIDHSVEREAIDVGMLGGYKKLIPGFMRTSFNLQMEVGGLVTTSDELTLADFKTANSMNITELFKVINKKLNERKKNG